MVVSSPTVEDGGRYGGRWRAVRDEVTEEALVVAGNRNKVGFVDLFLVYILLLFLFWFFWITFFFDVTDRLSLLRLKEEEEDGFSSLFVIRVFFW